MRRKSEFLSRSIMGCGLAFSMMLVSPDNAVAFKVLHAFNGGDGFSPRSDLLRDGAGNLYGTTYWGGGSGCDLGGCGTVFKLSRDGTETVLYSFTGGADGASPVSDMIRDRAGNLYGVTNSGGANNLGAVFKLAFGGGETVLYSFAGGSDGRYPYGGLTKDGAGNFYGTTVLGGGNDNSSCGSGAGGCGTVFKLSPGGTETVLYRFCARVNCDDGSDPQATLLRDRAGDLYGTTTRGGGYGNGTVFKLTTNGTETVLHSFTGGRDGGLPYAGLIGDGKGNLFGTTAVGGFIASYCETGCGAVFRLSPDGTETVLHTFTGGNDGSDPASGLIRDGAGNFYGTTRGGGTSNSGTVFELAPDDTENVLHSFTRPGIRGGADPSAGLIIDKAGYLYGTASAGGVRDFGAVFRLTK
jgi:uncharacterized repeat protein (TIGR03803 family)